MDYQRSNMYMRGPDHLVADDHGEYILGLIRDIWEVLDAIHNFLWSRTPALSFVADILAPLEAMITRLASVVFPSQEDYVAFREPLTGMYPNPLYGQNMKPEYGHNGVAITSPSSCDEADLSPQYRQRASDMLSQYLPNPPQVDDIYGFQRAASMIDHRADRDESWFPHMSDAEVAIVAAVRDSHARLTDRLRYLERVWRARDPLASGSGLHTSSAIVRPAGTFELSKSSPGHQRRDQYQEDLNRRPQLAATKDELIFKMQCLVCLEQPATVVMATCGHTSLCSWCTNITVPLHPTLDNVVQGWNYYACPLCREIITHRFRVLGIRSRAERNIDRILYSTTAPSDDDSFSFQSTVLPHEHPTEQPGQVDEEILSDGDSMEWESTSPESSDREYHPDSEVFLGNL